jgi:hypothetical protein
MRIILRIKPFNPIDFKVNKTNIINFSLLESNYINSNTIIKFFSNGHNIYISQKNYYLTGGRNLSQIKSWCIYSLGSIIKRFFHSQVFFTKLPIENTGFQLRIPQTDTFIQIKLEENDVIIYDIDSLVAFEEGVKLSTFIDLISFLSIHSWILKQHFFSYIKGPGLVILKTNHKSPGIIVDKKNHHTERLDNLLFLPAYCKILSEAPNGLIEFYTNYDYIKIENDEEQEIHFQVKEYEYTRVKKFIFPIWKLIKLFFVP